MASGPITSWETVETVSDFIFLAPKSLQMVIAAMKWKDAHSLEGKLWPAYTARESHGIPLLYSYLENPMDGGAW